MVRAEIEYRRSVCGGLTELVDDETVELTSKTAILKHAREIKKMIASECKYNINGDHIFFKINYLQMQ